MAGNHQKARREAFSIVKDTCPVVDEAFDTAIKAVKSQTEALRDALISTLQRAFEAEDRVNDLEWENVRLQNRLNDYE